MLRRLPCFLLIFVCLPVSFAERAAQPRQLSSVFIVRTGEPLQAPYALSYHMYEYALVQGRWIFPDVGYYDAGHANDGQWFIGAGPEIYHNRHFTWTQEVYAVQEAGSAAHNQRYLWIWPILDLRFTKRLTSQTVLFPTVPLNKSARWGFDIDRSKVEYAIRPHLQVGAGYNATKSATGPWVSRPFLTTTVTNKTGAWEFWLERVEDGAQVQLRYQLVHPHS